MPKCCICEQEKCELLQEKMHLKDWLRRTKITISKFAVVIGIDRSYLHSLLKGKKRPSDKLMKRIKEVTMGYVSSKQELVGEKKRSKKYCYDNVTNEPRSAPKNLH
jgi:hypothetical protein